MPAFVLPLQLVSAVDVEEEKEGGEEEEEEEEGVKKVSSITCQSRLLLFFSCLESSFRLADVFCDTLLFWHFLFSCHFGG